MTTTDGRRDEAATSEAADLRLAGESPQGPDEFDVIVIGGGPVGENVAQYAHDGGLSVMLVDRELFGGECSYYACMPSKALLRTVDVTASTQHLPGVVPTHIDREALLARRDAWVSHYDDASQVDWARDAGLGTLRGHARLVGERLVEVTGEDGARVLRAACGVVIATGSVATVPPEYDGVLAWGSRDATGVVEVPDRLAVIGGGVVACEAATWMNALGSHVTMFVRGEALLAGQEPYAGQFVAEGLRAAGVQIEFDSSVVEATREGGEDTGLGRVHGGPVTLVVRRGDGAREREFDEVLLATGRRPRLGDVGLDAVGLGPDDVQEGSLPEWLHVIGDAGTGAPLTHMGKYEARVLGAKLTGLDESDPPRSVPVPQVVFTDPQVASVGLTENAARDAGHQVVTAEVPFASSAGSALLRDDVSGRAKIVVDERTRTIVGATFCGPDAAELLHAATIAVVGEVPVSTLRHAVPSYPTASELWLRLLELLPRHLRA